MGRIQVAVRTTIPIPPAGVAAVAALCGMFCGSATPTTRANSLTVEPPNKHDLRQRVEAFVRGVTKNPGFADSESLVRWNAPICPFRSWIARGRPKGSVSPADADHPGSRGTAGHANPMPNLTSVIIVTSEPDRVLEAWYARNKQLFGDATLSQIHHFLDTSGSRPIRVWRNIDRGRRASSRLDHFVPKQYLMLNPHRSSGMRYLISLSVFAIVDTNLASHATLDQQTRLHSDGGTVECRSRCRHRKCAFNLAPVRITSKRHRPGSVLWDAAFVRGSLSIRSILAKSTT